MKFAWAKDGTYLTEINKLLEIGNDCVILPDWGNRMGPMVKVYHAKFGKINLYLESEYVKYPKMFNGSVKEILELHNAIVDILEECSGNYQVWKAEKEFKRQMTDQA